MQIIYKTDLIFTAIYSALILGTGIGIFLATGHLTFFLISIATEGIYLLLALRHPYKRFRAIKKPFPEPWKDILNKYSLFYRGLDDLEKKHYENDISIFLSDFSIEGIRRSEIDIETKLIVASGFATMLHGRPYWEPPIKDGVLVYPGDSFDRHYRLGRGNRAGQASINSPLIVTEESLKESFSRADDGYNVVFHELAHYFDLEDGIADGIPSARLPKDKIPRWKELIHHEWQRAVEGNSILRSYAATNEVELFAVAVEFFFENPEAMKNHCPDLYDELKLFFAFLPSAAGDFVIALS